MRVKICGLRSRAEVAAAAAAGAAYVGFVFFPASPRHVSLADAAWIAGGIPEGLIRVALTVDADDETLADVIEAAQVDMLQLQGGESPERVAEIRARFEVPVMKAVGIATEEDLPLLDAYSEVADQLLVDARALPGAERPGGNGQAFDWRIIRACAWRRPWMLAGGLTAENVAEAVRLTGADQVDVSSGVESRPGFKDPARIAAFVHAAHEAQRLAV
jgi:phosphoribosylanthranilate isomerase